MDRILILMPLLCLLIVMTGALGANAQTTLKDHESPTFTIPDSLDLADKFQDLDSLMKRKALGLRDLNMPNYQPDTSRQYHLRNKKPNPNIHFYLRNPKGSNSRQKDDSFR